MPPGDDPGGGQGPWAAGVAGDRSQGDILAHGGLHGFVKDFRDPDGSWLLSSDPQGISAAGPVSSVTPDSSLLPRADTTGSLTSSTSLGSLGSGEQERHGAREGSGQESVDAEVVTGQANARCSGLTVPQVEVRICTGCPARRPHLPGPRGETKPPSPLPVPPPDIFEGATAFIFDFDDTLADSAFVWAEATRALMERHGIIYDPSLHEEIGGLETLAAAEYVCTKWGLDEPVAEVAADWRARYHALYATKLHYIPGAPAFLRAARRRGIRTAIATAGDRERLDIYFSAHPGTRELFDEVVTTLDVQHPKPHPAVYQECMRRLGAAPAQAVIFEDSLRGLQGAGETGARVVCLLTNEWFWEKKREMSRCMARDFWPLLHVLEKGGWGDPN